MSDSLTALKEQASDTAEALGEKVKRFETGVRQQAQATRKAAENLFTDTITTPKAAEAVLKYEIREYPKAALGVAGILGFVTTYWFGNTWGPALRFVAKEFDPELKKMKSAAILLATKAASSKLKSAYPGMVEKLSGILEAKIQS